MEKLQTFYYAGIESKTLSKKCLKSAQEGGLHAPLQTRGRQCGNWVCGDRPKVPNNYLA